MAAVTAAVITAGAAAASAANSISASKKQQALQERALNQAGASGNLSPFNFIGSGGQFAGFGDAGNLNAFQAAGQGGGGFDFAGLAGLGTQVQPGGPGGLVDDQRFFIQPDGSGRVGAPQQRLSGSDARRNAIFGGGGGQQTTTFPDGSVRNTTPGTTLQQRFGLGQDPTALQNKVGQTIFTGLGDLEPARQGLTALANQQIGRAGLGGGLPGNVANAAAQSQAQLSSGFDADFGTLSALEGAAGSQFANAFGDLNAQRQSGFQRGFQDAAFGGATNLAGIAGQDPQAVAQQRLDLLRQQAQPFEDRQFQDLQENLFATGRGGTSGGALQTEAFARGLGQADLSRQLAASAEGRAFQNQALQGAQGLAGVGNQTATLEDNLLSQAFGRFSNTLGLSQGLSDTRFNRGQNLNQIGNNNAQQNLQNQIQLAGVGRSLQASDLNLANTALQSQSGLRADSLAQFQAALQASALDTNAKIGAQTNISNLASNANFGAKNDALAGLFGTIANNRQGIQSGIEAIGGLFRQPVDQSLINQQTGAALAGPPAPGTRAPGG